MTSDGTGKTEELKADIVVIGGGGAGLTAAVAAAPRATTMLEEAEPEAAPAMILELPEAAAAELPRPRPAVCRAARIKAGVRNSAWSAKIKARELMAEFEQHGALPVEAPTLDYDDIDAYGPAMGASGRRRLRPGR